MENQIVNVLLIEDNPADIRLVEFLLLETDAQHINLESFHTLGEAKEKLARNDYQIILLDLTLPDNRGVHMINELNATKPEVPIIVLTGMSDEKIAREAINLGAQDYLIKGYFAGDTLIKAISYAIERNQLQLALIRQREELKEALEKLKTNQKKLLEIENLKSVQGLAAGLSHEIAQPLQALSNYIGLMEETGATKKYLLKSKSMVQRISELNMNLRQITRLEKMNYLDTEIIDINASSSPSTTKEPHILVVDDEPYILETMQEMLGMKGYKCDGALNGREALELVDKNDYSLVISDVMMPEMSGPEFFEAYRASGHKAVFIFLTGYEIPDKYKETIKKAEAVLTKPVSFGDFFNSLEKISNVRPRNDKND